MENTVNIFETAKFGDHYDFNGNDCIYLEKVSDTLYRVAVHKHVKYEDGGEKDFADIMLVHSDGFAYVETNGDEWDETKWTYFYVKPLNKTE